MCTYTEKVCWVVGKKRESAIPTLFRDTLGIYFYPFILTTLLNGITEMCGMNLILSIPT